MDMRQVKACKDAQRVHKCWDMRFHLAALTTRSALWPWRVLPWRRSQDPFSNSAALCSSSTLGTSPSEEFQVLSALELRCCHLLSSLSIPHAALLCLLPHLFLTTVEDFHCMSVDGDNNPLHMSGVVWLCLLCSSPPRTPAHVRPRGAITTTARLSQKRLVEQKRTGFPNPNGPSPSRHKPTGLPCSTIMAATRAGTAQRQRKQGSQNDRP